jgi:hypothetical protein
MALPAEVTYLTVTGKLTKAVADGVDADLFPDGVPLQGQLTFRPEIGPRNSYGALKSGGRITVGTAVPKLIVVVDPIPLSLAADGTFSVNLVDPKNPLIAPADWSWTVSFDLVGAEIEPFSFMSPAGSQTLDLADVVPQLISTGGATFINEAAASAASAAASAASAALSASLVGAPVDSVVAGLLANPASLTRAQGNSTYLPAHIAAVTGDGATDDAPAINAALALGGRVVVPYRGTGVCVLGAQLVIGSNTSLVIEPNVTLRRKVGVFGNLIVNASLLTQRSAENAVLTAASTTMTSATAAFTAGDVGKNITVTGAGVGGGHLATTIAGYTNATTVTLAVAATTSISGATLCIFGARDTNIALIGATGVVIDGGSNTAGTAVLVHHVRFRHVDGLTIQGFKTTSVAGKFAVSLGDVTDYDVRNLKFNVSSDGVHIQGPALHGIIDNISGYTGDDFIGIIPNDWSGTCDVAGDVIDLVITNLYPEASIANAIQLVGGAGCITKSIRARGVYGSVNKFPITIGNEITHPQTATGSLDQIVVEDVTCKPLADFATVVLRPVAGGTFTLRNITKTVAGAVIQVGDGVITTAVNTLLVESPRILSTGVSHVVTVFGTVSDLTVRSPSGVVPASYQVVNLAGAVASVARLTIVDDHTSGGSAIVGAIVVGQVLGMVTIVGSQHSGTHAWIGDLATVTTLHMIGSNFNSSNGTFSVRATGNLSIYSSGCRYNSAGITVAAGGVVRCWNSDLRTDIAKLTKGNGDTAYNTNAALTPVSGTAAGLVGPCVCDGTVWKNLATASTF